MKLHMHWSGVVVLNYDARTSATRDYNGEKKSGGNLLANCWPWKYWRWAIEEFRQYPVLTGKNGNIWQRDADWPILPQVVHDAGYDPLTSITNSSEPNKSPVPVCSGQTENITATMNSPSDMSPDSLGSADLITAVKFSPLVTLFLSQRRMRLIRLMSLVSKVFDLKQEEMFDL